MDTASLAFIALINNANTKAECNQIQQRLTELQARVQSKISAQAQAALHFQGRGAVPCALCDNTMDPRGDSVGTCESCNNVTCTDCHSICKDCDKLLCTGEADCGMEWCESCEEHVCQECSEACWKCSEPTCHDCLKPVGVPGWQCCAACVDDWVEDGWHEY